MAEVIRKAIEGSIVKVFKDRRVVRHIWTTEDLDRDQEVITFSGWHTDAFMKSGSGRFLWSHDYKGLPIGKVVDLYKRPRLKRWEADVEYASKDLYEFADVAYGLVSEGYLEDTSAGFMPLNVEGAFIRGDVEKGEPATTWLKKELLEISLCNIGSNPGVATIARAYQKQLEMTYQPKVFVEVAKDISPIERLEDAIVQLETMAGLEEEGIKIDDRAEYSKKVDEYLAWFAEHKKKREIMIIEEADAYKWSNMAIEKAASFGLKIDDTGRPLPFAYVHKPETTDNYHRIPAPGEAGKHDDHKIKTIDIDKGKGIKALYCGDCKVVATYLFDTDQWSMADAKKWVQEHKDIEELDQETHWLDVYELEIEIDQLEDRLEVVEQTLAALSSEDKASENEQQAGDVSGEDAEALTRHIISRLKAVKDGATKSRALRLLLQELSAMAKKAKHST